jgi:hypothetical protein
MSLCVAWRWEDSVTLATDSRTSGPAGGVVGCVPKIFDVRLRYQRLLMQHPTARMSSSRNATAFANLAPFLRRNMAGNVCERQRILEDLL